MSFSPTHRVSIIICSLVAAIAVRAQEWTEVPVPGEVYNHFEIAASNGRFVVTTGSHVYYSDDGENWLDSGFQGSVIKSLSSSNNRFIVLSGSDVYTSKNGANWIYRSRIPGVNEDDVSPENTSADYRIASDGTGAVAVRFRLLNGEFFTYGESAIFYTPDLEHWYRSDEFPDTTSETGPSLRNIVYGNGRYMAAYWPEGSVAIDVRTRTTLAWSVDGGESWERIESDLTGAPSEVVYGNSVFLGIMVNGRLIRSTDGEVFESVSGLIPSNLYPQINFGGGRFFAHSSNDTDSIMYSSSDGLNWTTHGNLPIRRINHSYRVAFAADRHIAVGSHFSDGLQYFMLSAQLNGPPVITRQPESVAVHPAGRKAALTVESNVLGTTTYQWFKNGEPIPNAKFPAMIFQRAKLRDSGDYYCILSNSIGSVYSDTATISIVPAAVGGRLSNLSVNAYGGINTESLNVGFGLRGSARKPVTIRAVGPTLATFGVAATMTDPSIALIRGEETLRTNDNWTEKDGSELGGFQLPTNSLDAVVDDLLAPGLYAVVVDASIGNTGTVLTELYDGNLEDGLNLLNNLSARALVTPTQSLIAGFVITGTTDLPVIIRAVGPTLEDFGIPNALVDPRITLYRDNELIANNEDWLENDGRNLGAFPLPEGSADSVLSIRLSPGIYTAHVTAAESTPETGIVLLEVYDAFE